MTDAPEPDAPTGWFQNQVAQFLQHPAAQIGRSVPNAPSLDGMFAPPISPAETIRILRELLADAGKAIALRDLQISALRLELNVATRERDAALSGGVAPPDVETFPARALLGGDGIPRDL